VRAAARRHARLARLTAGIAAAALALLGAAGAQAQQSSGSDQEAARLRAQGDDLAQKSRGAALELYAIQSQLGRAQTRLANLRVETRQAERLEAQERARLADARRILDEAEGQLGERLRELYVEGDPDPITILLAAESLDEAISTIDNLDRFARQDVQIVGQVREARASLRTSVEKLAAQAAQLESLTAEAIRTEASLRSARDERQAFLAQIAHQKQLNQAELNSLASIATAAEEKNDTVSSGGGSPSAPSPPPPSSPPAGGTRMTVQATGYALPGTTATGIPVGWGVVAVDPSVIPLGTKMYIPGYGEGVAADTGSAVQGRIIDLWFPTRAQALAWGRRTVTITIH
jgi:3D (Asp-Asp-Asp) domain-containing protein/peptidoglycan hydrolase CwlO-like protein